jgi:hypothetical protein
MYKILTFTTAFLFFSTISLAQFDDLKDQAEDAKDEVTEGSSGSELSEEEIVKGLKEALQVGIKKGSDKVSKVDGYFKNPNIKIPFPPDMKEVEEHARSAGMDKKVDKVIKKMNRAAEDAADRSKPIFVDAIKSMSISEGKEILEGKDTAATHFLRNNTYQQLYDEFRPEIEESLNEVDITRYWDEVITAYNQMPMTENKNPDLADYVTHRALEGLFYMVGQEERKIRQDPVARTKDILKKVFGD